MCLKYYALGPCHCFNILGLRWDAMLKRTEIELELISVTDMYLFIEKRIRGGISYIAKRYSKTNNIKMIKSQVNTLHILMQIIYMGGKGFNIYHMVNLNG